MSEIPRPLRLFDDAIAVRLVDGLFACVLVGSLALAVARGFPPVVLGGVAVGIVGMEYLISRTVTDDVVRTLGSEADTDGRVQDLVADISAGLGIDPPRVAVVDDRGLVVADGSDERVVLVPEHLVATLDEGALRGVLAHELAHVSLGHLRRVPLREAASTVVGCAICWSVVLAGQSRPVALALGTGYLLAAMYRGGRVNWTVYVVGSLGVTFVLDALAAAANRSEELRADDLAVRQTGPVAFATGLYNVGTTTDGAGGVAGPNPFGRRRTLLQRLTAPYPTVETRLARLGVSPDDITDATEARATESTD